MQKNFCNYDVEISNILTVCVHISDNILSNDEQGSVGRQGCRVPGVQLYVVGWSVDTPAYHIPLDSRNSAPLPPHGPLLIIR